MAEWATKDEGLIERISGLLSVAPVRSKNMFGTTAWFLESNDMMFAGAWGDGVTVRVGVDRTNSLINSGDAEPFNPIGGNKAMKEFILLSSERIAEDTTLLDWLTEASDFAGALPSKQKKPRKKKSS